MAELDGGPVSVDDLQSLALLNYGHYTSMRAEEQTVRGLTLHLERLARDCRQVFESELDLDRVLSFVRHAAQGKTGSYSLRVTIFDPSMDMGHLPKQAAPRVLITTRPVTHLPATPLRVQTASYERDLPGVKHIGLFGAMAHRRSAQVDGFDDVLFVDQKGRISEGATWNVGFFDGHDVIWPEAEVLPGVTMLLLQEAHKQTRTRPVRLSDAATMSAAFATNTTVGVRPISSVDGITFPADHAILTELQDEYLKIPTESL